ncbi:MAG: dihydroorotase [Candidatus Omnitrophota bacterium]
MAVLIRGGRVVDPYNNTDGVFDLLIEGSKIIKVAAGIKDAAVEVIEASGKIVIPGLVDMHVHLREPGREDKETLLSGTIAALAGGVTSILAMPNTTPAMDSVDSIKILKERIDANAKANVFICGAITKERAGKDLVDIEALKKEGVIAISDDGASVDSDSLMLAAFKEAVQEGLLVICHSEDKSASCAGVVNLGFTSTRLGLRGISKESEYKRVLRDIELAKEAKAKVHIAHLSCLESVDAVLKAKQRGARVTVETCPHYFSFTEEAVLTYDTNFKMNPPLRSAADSQALKDAISSGIIDVIASDHAPHTENEKDIEFERAEFGVIGLETALLAAITELVDKGVLGWADLVKRMSLNPARILGINKGSLSVGADADIAIIDPVKEQRITKERFLSKSKNSPFIGRTLKGCVEYTLCLGKVYKWNS